MRLLVSLSAVPLAAAIDYGYWDVAYTRSWAANGYNGWTVAANYSGTPGVTKHGSYQHIPPPNNENASFTDTTKQDDDFQGVSAGEYFKLKPSTTSVC